MASTAITSCQFSLSYIYMFCVLPVYYICVLCTRLHTVYYVCEITVYFVLRKPVKQLYTSCQRSL